VQSTESLQRAREHLDHHPDEAYRLAAEQLDDLADPTERGEALAIMAISCFHRVRWDEADRLVEQALPLFGDTVCPQRVDLWVMRSLMRRDQGDLLAAVDAAQTACDAIEGLADPARQASAYNVLALARKSLGEHAAALTAYEHAYQVLNGADTDDARLLRRTVLYNSAALLIERHDHELALRRLDELRASMEPADVPRVYASASSYAVHCHRALGSPSEVLLDYLSDAVAAWKLLPPGTADADLAVAEGALAAERGDPAHAVERLEHADGLYTAEGRTQRRSSVATLLLQQLAKLGRHEEAVRKGRDVLGVLVPAAHRSEVLAAMEPSLEALGAWRELAERRGERLSLEAELADVERGRALREAEVRLRVRVAESRADQLDELVRERTQALERVNRALEAEVRRHRATAGQLRAARDQAQAADRAKTTFLRVASHELRTPLNAVLGYGELIAETLDDLGLEDPELDSDLECLLAAAQRQLGMVDQLLTMSELSAGLEPTAEQSARAEHAERAVEAACRRAIGSAAEVRTELSPEVCLAMAPAHLQRLVEALVDNALKFTDRGTVDVVLRPEGDHVVLRVRDQGVGMDAATVEQLGRPFWQADQGSTRQHDGLGLGLALVRGICSELGGELDIESEPGHGTTVTVRLPASGAAHRAAC
jgi:signal transduction histidine kinase